MRSMDMPDSSIAELTRRIASTEEGAIDDQVELLRRLIFEKLTYAVGRDTLLAGDRDWFVATVLALRDHIVHRWLASARDDSAQQRKRVYYLSLEFLPGRVLFDSL